MKFTAIFENSALSASVTQEYEVEDNTPIKEIYKMLIEDADDFMLDYCEDEEDEENMGGTYITITDLG